MYKKSRYRDNIARSLCFTDRASQTIKYTIFCSESKEKLCEENAYEPFRDDMNAADCENTPEIDFQSVMRRCHDSKLKNRDNNP